jgi:hypothetical protein
MAAIGGFMTKTDAEAIAGSLSKPSKMPGLAYGLPAEECITGRKLHAIENTVCSNCYALKGFYKTYAKTIKPAQYKRLESISHPMWIDAMCTLIRGSEFFRWHDSGDLQSVDHLRKIVEIAVRMPEVKFWLPTREYAIVSEYLASGAVVPKNLVIRLSAHKIDGPVPESGLPTSSVYSETVPKGAHECPARYQDNSCGDCRACWNPRVKHVSYHQH